MRILLHSVPPWAHSGYGHQCRLAARALAGLGHDVAISAYAGVHEERDYQGIPVMGTGGQPYGNAAITVNYRRWNADLLVLFTDLFVIDPEQMAGLTVMPWVPVDCDPLGVMEKRWLATAGKIAGVHPVAMSCHGQKMLAAEGWDAPVVPHATEMVPDPAAGLAWRREMGLQPEHFVIGKVGVNNEDDRKAFGVTMQAFAAFAAKRKRAALYVHTLAQVPKAPNLAMMAVRLELRGKVAFCDQERRLVDLFGQAWMQGMYSGLDVLDIATKGEGFGCPAIDALACGTPVIAARNSAMPEKISREYGWLVGGNREWARHHNAWWVTPGVAELGRAYTAALSGAKLMRPAAERAGRTWSVSAMAEAWAKALAGI